MVIISLSNNLVFKSLTNFKVKSKYLLKSMGESSISCKVMLFVIIKYLNVGHL